MKKLKLALDWTPNVNHIGFFIAKEKGYFQELGIEVEILDPSEDDYKITPAKKVELGLADFALCPTESIISYQTKNKPFDLVAIAAILQEDLSAIIVKTNSGINSPKDLDNKTYSSYKARYEDGVVKEMIKNDGGTGDLKIIYPDKLGIWNTLLNDSADATWVFLNWEGIEANQMSEELRYFRMKDFNIPYSYSPVIASSLSNGLENKQYFKDFLNATKKGFLYCKKNVASSTSILSKYLKKSDAKIDLKAALEMSIPHFGNADNWGIINEKVITNFLEWINDKHLEKTVLPASKIYTNQFFN